MTFAATVLTLYPEMFPGTLTGGALVASATDVEAPSMDFGCFDCPAADAALLDAVVTLLVILPVVLAFVWVGYRIVSRLRNRE